MKNLIKIVGQESLVNDLKTLGFQYITTEFRQEKVFYVFEDTDELRELLIKNFSNVEFELGNTLIF